MWLNGVVEKDPKEEKVFLIEEALGMKMGELLKYTNRKTKSNHFTVTKSTTAIDEILVRNPGSHSEISAIIDIAKKNNIEGSVWTEIKELLEQKTPNKK